MDIWSGYEEFEHILKMYDRDKYLLATTRVSRSMVRRIFEVYRGVGIYPIKQFNKAGMISEIKKCIAREIHSESSIFDIRFNQGGALCRFLFPEMRDVTQAGDPRTLNAKFNDNHMLKRAIMFCLKYKKSRYPVMPSGIKDGLEMMGGGVATNFKPMSAKALYERYCPIGGTIYDYAAGFGGRMLGAMSSSNNYKYICTDPNTNTNSGLKELSSLISETIGRDDITVLNECSEDVTLPAGSIDMAFSSPPYFDLEVYTEEDTQSVNRYPTLDLWMEQYTYITMKNIYNALKRNGIFAFNIADYNYKSRTTYIVDRWIEMAKSIGFTPLEYSDMALQTRRGVGHDNSNKRSKREGIFIFSKN